VNRMQYCLACCFELSHKHHDLTHAQSNQYFWTSSCCPLTCLVLS
jgi:hypothetical protein